jgi:ribosome biogenesis GTPase / thiamine phosphate phosphatase
MKGKKKKKKRVRKQDWAVRGEDSFTRDLKRHLRTNTFLPPEFSTVIPPEEVSPNATVISHTKKYAFVEKDGSERLCRIEESLLEGGASLLAPGDAVLVEEYEGEPFVRAVGVRRSKLSRLAIEHSRVQEQVLAANIDLLVIVIAAAQPAPKAGLVDRYLIAAEVGGVRPLLCVNKIDVVDHLPHEVDLYRELGVEIVETSCHTGHGIETLRDRLRGNVGVLAGQSGVGKSSLLNAMDPDLELATQEISSFNEKGRHTTSMSKLYKLDGGSIRIIDTPGIRQLGVWGVQPADLSVFFPEIHAYAQQCQFRDCTHTHEPGCAVKAAFESGAIPRLRFESYQRIRENLSDRARKY